MPIVDRCSDWTGVADREINDRPSPGSSGHILQLLTLREKSTTDETRTTAASARPISVEALFEITFSSEVRTITADSWFPPYMVRMTPSSTDLTRVPTSTATAQDEVDAEAHPVVGLHVLDPPLHGLSGGADLHGHFLQGAAAVLRQRSDDAVVELGQMVFGRWLPDGEHSQALQVVDPTDVTDEGLVVVHLLVAPNEGVHLRELAASGDHAGGALMDADVLYRRGQLSGGGSAEQSSYAPAGH